jgi:hypothetical protein
MSKTARFLAKWRVLGVMMAVLGASAPAYAQTLVCKGWRDIESEPGKPFTAQRVSHNVMHYPDGSEHTELLNSDIARDSDGRVYSERHFDRNASAVPEKINQTPGDSSSNRARIYSMMSFTDCGGGKAVTIFPDLKIARVTEGPRIDLPHGSFFEALAYMQRPSNTVFEDLGFKEIEGFPTHGFRVTVLGTEADGEWNGKPTHVTECWVSDDLAATMLEIRSNLRGKRESRDTLTHIKRREPDVSQFEIPTDYKINPPEEKPKS